MLPGNPINPRPPAAAARVDLGGGYECGLRGRPSAQPVTRLGTVTVQLGLLPSGRPLTVAVTSLEWLDDLEFAIQAARAAGVVEAGMSLAGALAVTR